MKKILLTAAAVAGLFAATSAVHASGDAVCPVTGKTASGETAKKDGSKGDDAKKEGGKKCCGSK